MMANGFTSVVIAFNMKMVLFFCACLNNIHAQTKSPVEVIKNTFEITDSGGFAFSFSTSDGTQHMATGEMKTIDMEREALVVKGTYSFIASDGRVYQVDYIADEKGYRPIFKIVPITVVRIDSACLGSLCGTGLG